MVLPAGLIKRPFSPAGGIPRATVAIQFASKPCRPRYGGYREWKFYLWLKLRRILIKDAPHIMTVKHSVSAQILRTALATVAVCGLTACGGKERPVADLAASQVTTIGVNSYLWRASLEAVSFAPLLQADSAGGVIVTDWYSRPDNPADRVKVSVAILDQDLRADALRVAASRQVLQGGTWVDAPVQAATVQKLEDIILTKARDLRRQTLS